MKSGAWLSALTLLFGTGTTLAQERWSGSADLRNRFVSDVGGIDGVYRSVVNRGQGPRLYNGDLRFVDPGGKKLDELNVSGSGWGGDPYSSVHLDARATELYELRFNYRGLSYFNDLPTFANPLLQEGLLLSQRSVDLERRLLDVELELRPSSRIVPFLHVLHNDNAGRGVTTFVTNGDEFPVGTDFDNQLTSFRGGLKLNLSHWNLTLEQGGTDFADAQQLRYESGPAGGNNRRPVLGNSVELERLDQRYDVDGGGSFSRAAFQARPSDKASFAGQFAYSRPHIDVRQSLSAAGLFVSPLLTQFSNFTENALGDATKPHSAASWTTVLRLTKKLRIVQSWFTDRFEISSAASVTETLDSATATERDLLRRTTLSLSRNQIDAMYDLNRRATVRVGHRYEWGAAETPTASLTFGSTGSRRGLVRRHVALASATVRAGSKLRLALDFESSPGNQTFFRTGLMNYKKGKARVRYKMSEDLVLTGSFSALDNRNDDPAIDLDYLNRRKSVSLTWSPRQRPFSLVADYTRSNLSSSTSTVGLPFFGVEIASYRERAHQGGLYVDVRLPRDTSLNAGGTLYAGDGSRPSRFYQPRVSVDARLGKRVRWVAEWRWHSFAERFLRVESFRAHEVSVGIQASLRSR